MNETTIQITIAIYENSTSSIIAKKMRIEDFTPGFHEKYNSGEIEKCYFTKHGRLVARDIWGRLYTRMHIKNKVKIKRHVKIKPTTTMNDEISIAIHESKDSEKIMKFINLDKFTRSFKKLYNNGEIWGCYYNKNGTISAQDRQGSVYYKIISRKKQHENPHSHTAPACSYITNSSAGPGM